MESKTKTRLDQLLEVITKDKVYIQTHDYPDQDAISSAYGLQELLRQKGIEAVICYQGVIDKANTISMVKILGIELYDVDTIDFKEDDEIILVDGQKGNINLEEQVGDEIACIDHHPEQNTDLYRFYDIRTVGACATLIAGYYIENHIEINEKVATALVYGIKMDTANLVRQTTAEDVDMFCYLYKRCNVKKLRRFEGNQMQMSDLTAYREALNSLRIYENGVGFADVGAGCSEAMMGTLSDFIMELEQVEFSVVFSCRAGGLKMSIRNEIPQINAGRLAQIVLEGYPGGGGGHSGMAGGFIPGILERDAKAVEHTITERINDQINETLKEKMN